MFKRTSARLTNRDDPLKHRCFLDYNAEAVKRTSRCYDEFVRKLGLEKTSEFEWTVDLDGDNCGENVCVVRARAELINDKKKKSLRSKMR